MKAIKFTLNLFSQCNMTIIKSCILAALILLYGCAAHESVYGDNGALDPNQSIKPQLETTATSIEHSLLALAATQEPYISDAVNTNPLTTPQGGMGGTVTIDWSGPIEPLLEKVANMSQYKVKVMGNEPAVPIIVSITATNTTLADIIKNAGLQAGKRANIVVYPNSRIIELRYAVS